MPDRVAEIDVMQAAVIKVLANAQRLQVIGLLARGPLEVNVLAGRLGLSQAAASQHLSAMRGAGLVTAHRDGRVIRYALADPKIFAACQILRDVIGRRLSSHPSQREPSPSQVTHA